MRRRPAQRGMRVAGAGISAVRLPNQRQELFEQARINPENGAVEWPGDVDLDPEVLYGRYEPASGHHIARRTVHEPVTAGT